MDDARKRVLIRLVGAPLLIAALAGILYWDHRRADNFGLETIVLVLSYVAFGELCAMMKLQGLRPADRAGAWALFLMYCARTPMVLRYFGVSAADARFLSHASVLIGGTAALLAIYLIVKMAFRYGKFSPPDAGATLLAFVWASLGLTLTLWPPTFADGDISPASWYLVFLFATNKGSDMAAYSVGKLIGRHKLAPEVSPNKTWEGAVAGFLVGAGLGAWVLLGPLRNDFRGATWALVLMAATVAVSAQLGDLAKSAVKRWAGVKDSGRLLPEFGGALDMIDTFLLSGPVAWIFVQILK